MRRRAALALRDRQKAEELAKKAAEIQNKRPREPSLGDSSAQQPSKKVRDDEVSEKKGFPFRKTFLQKPTRCAIQIDKLGHHLRPHQATVSIH